MDHNILELQNGIRVVHKEVNNTRIVHCGFVLNIGSRDEKSGQEGIGHFWEHMVFKGTKKRKAYHIINRLESVGGELNAYTTKEKICFYASVLDQYFEKAIDLLTDITFHSVFPEKEIDKERMVILEEMAMYKDIPEDALQDDFDQLLFPSHSLGHNILGTEENIRSIIANDFRTFLEENMDTSQIVFSVVGNFPFKKVKKLAEKYISVLPLKNGRQARIMPDVLKSDVQYVNKNITQAYCAIGTRAYSIKAPERLKFFTLVNILGGPAMNSRLNMSLREKYGFVYSIEAQYTPYSDCGSIAIFFGTEMKQFKRSINLVLQEIRKLKNVPLGVMQLHRIKDQIMGQLAMSEENNTSLMLMMGRSLLDLDRIDTLEEIFSQIRLISSSDLRDVTNEVFVEDTLNYLNFIPDGHGNY